MNDKKSWLGLIVFVIFVGTLIIVPAPKQEQEYTLKDYEVINTIDKIPILDISINYCKTICDSHNYATIGVAGGIYSNDVCICKDTEERIWTFVM